MARIKDPNSEINEEGKANEISKREYNQNPNKFNWKDNIIEDKSAQYACENKLDSFKSFANSPIKVSFYYLKLWLF